MRTRRTALFLGALSLALAPASAAMAAKPVSTYTVSFVESSFNTVSISVSDAGVGSFSLFVLENALVDCGDGTSGIQTTTYVATDSPADVTFDADRKMNTANAVATGDVARSVLSPCAGQSVDDTVSWTVSLSAVASAKADRGRTAAGDRFISRDADVTYGFNGLARALPMNGSITETISK